MWHTQTDTAVLALLGDAIKQARVTDRLRQADLAEQSGVSLATVQRLEAGQPVRTDSLIRCLRILRLLDRLATVFRIDEPPSPFVVLETKPKRPRRVRPAART